MGREVMSSVLYMADLEKGWVHLFCQGPDIKNFRLHGLRGKIEGMMKVLIKQEGRLPFSFASKVGTHSSITCMRNKGKLKTVLNWQALPGGSTLLRLPWLLFPCPVSPFWSPSTSLVNNTPITGSRSYPSDSEPVGCLHPDHEVQGRDKCLISPVEMKTIFCLGSSVC